MNISFHKYYIKVQSPTLCRLIAFTNGLENVNAGAFWPFLFMKHKTHPLNEQWINHERIHFRQQIELVYIFYGIIMIGERMYLRLVKGMSAQDAYLYSTFEQECYRNQQNTKYLKTRKPYSFARYFKDKKKIRFEKDGEIKIS